ncbi:hypothetical protein C2845_PM17G01300 [Panicum miliaceum]|uniref:Uncharacterized protein n=1 Tax=Panicum miliaceum TaxID=4540 RepID=A0A3L6Q0I2_PANMI|nr:hypothetical protein C2845_PM17G01300 [Panicum miliaceum]
MQSPPLPLRPAPPPLRFISLPPSSSVLAPTTTENGRSPPPPPPPSTLFPPICSIAPLLLSSSDGISKRAGEKGFSLFTFQSGGFSVQSKGRRGNVPVYQPRFELKKWSIGMVKTQKPVRGVGGGTFQ